KGARVVALEAYRFGIVGDRQLVVALAVVGLAAIVEHVRVGGVELDRLRVVGDGAIMLALLIVDVAAVEVGERIGRIERDRLAVILYRGLLVAGPLVEHAALQMRLDADVLVVLGLVYDPAAGANSLLDIAVLLLADRQLV